MKPTRAQLWARFRKFYREYPDCGLAVDVSRLTFDDGFLSTMAKPMEKAFAAMTELEAGAIANPNENRRVGHYWLRNPRLAPEPALADAIAEAVDDVKEFARDVLGGRIAGERGPFKHVLILGIGGSALGPQFVADALGHPLTDRLDVRFFDNTDPDGMDRTLAPIVNELGQTLVIVISKSGRTPETRNGMIEVEDAYRRKGLRFARHAVAITEFNPGSQLYAGAQGGGWLRLFPIWDWVGGRTSVMSAVGLLPAALQGLNIDELLAGARACDDSTRPPKVARNLTEADLLANPAALLALGWYYAGAGRGARDMAVLPYKDRLALFAKYLQQLIMESLGKELDLDGRIVNQGITVYGNKGSTDQHAYVQQLRDGLPNFFVVFVQVLRSRAGESIDLEPGVKTGDYLNGFYLGARSALFEKGRESISITVPDVSARAVGALIALFERAVGFYASLIHINAYHQPGVQAGKDAAEAVLKLQKAVLEKLKAGGGRAFAVEELAVQTGSDDPELVYKVCQHLAANGRGITRTGVGPDATFAAN